MKIKLTKQEKNWILYDVGNSAFTLLGSNHFTDLFQLMQESRDFRMYRIWHTGDMQYPLQPYLQHLQDRYLEPLQIQKAIKNQFLQLHCNRNCFSRTGICKVLAGLSGSFCHCKGRIFRNAGILWFHACRCDIGRPDGWSLFPGLCVGIYRKLCTVCNLSSGCVKCRKIGITMEIAMMVSLWSSRYGG